MKFFLNTAARKFRLRLGGLRFGINAVTPDVIPPVLCEVTYDDNTCLMYDDGSYAEYD